MFGIGWSEFLVIVCIVVIFIRPKDLPAILQKVGKAYGQLKRSYKEIVSIKDQFVKEMNAAAAENAPTQDATTENVVAQNAVAQSPAAQTPATGESVSAQNNASSSDAPSDEPLYNESHEEQI